MKVATRIVYVLALLVFGLGVYLAFQRRRAEGPAGNVAAAATLSPATTSHGSPSAHSDRPATGAAASARPRPWSDVRPLSKEEIQHLRARMTPDRKEMNAVANQIRVRIRFSELYGLLDLDKAEIARFEKAAAEASLTFAELVGTPEQIAEHAVSQARSMDKVVSAALGPDHVPAFRAYLQTSDLRQMAAQLAVNSHYTNTPLTAGQADQFLQLALENRRETTPTPRIDPDTVNWDVVARRAREFLTPDQLRSLEAMLARRRFDAEFKDATGLPMRRPVRGI